MSQFYDLMDQVITPLTADYIAIQQSNASAATAAPSGQVAIAAANRNPGIFSSMTGNSWLILAAVGLALFLLLKR